MVLGTENLIQLIVCVIIGLVLIICCIYCCACKPACAKSGRRLLNRQIKNDEEAIDQERTAHRAGLDETLSANKQTRDEIRKKYQLR